MPMRTPVILLTCTACMLVAMCAYFRSELAHERSRAEAAELVQAELEEHVAELETTHEDLLTSMHAARAQDHDSLTLPGTTAPPITSLPTVRQRPFGLTVAQRRGFVRQRFGQLLKQLSLPESKAEALLDVIAAQEERAQTGAGVLANFRTNAEERERDSREIEALVGPEVAAKIARWQDLAMSRSSLRKVRDELEDLGEPLSEEQKTSLDQRFQALPTRPLMPKRDEGESNEAFSQRFREWRQDSRQQLRATVAPVLTPLQLKHYDELQDSQASVESQAFFVPPTLSPLGAAGSAASAR